MSSFALDCIQHQGLFHVAFIPLYITLHSMPLAEFAGRQDIPRPWRRPNPLKLPSIPALARGRQRQSSVEFPVYGQSKFRTRLRHGVTNIRVYFRSHFAPNERIAKSDCSGSPPASILDQFGSTISIHSEGPRCPRAPDTKFSSLRRKLSSRVLLDTQPGTIIVKPELRRPPSLHTLSSIQSDTTSLPQVVDTPPTSEGTTTVGSPGSIYRHENASMPAPKHQQFDLLASRKLSTIPEMDKTHLTSVKTCEAAAAAKVFLETRYNNLFSSTSARQARGESLEQRLTMMRLPPYLKHRIRRV